MMSFKLTHYGCSSARLLTIKRNNDETVFQGVMEEEELKDLVRTIQSCLPMSVCESSDIKFLNERLRKVEDKVVTFEMNLDSIYDRIKGSEDALIGHAGEHMKNNLVDRMRSVEINNDRIDKVLFTALGHLRKI